MTVAFGPQLELPKRASYSDVEPSLNRLGKSHELIVDIHRFRDAELSVESGLLALLLLAKRRLNRVIIQLGLELPAFDANPDFPLWQLFLRTASGLVLAQMSDAVLDAKGHDVLARIQDQQRKHLSKDDGLVWSGKEVAAPIVDRFGAPRVSPLLATPRIDDLDTLLEQMCCRLNLEPGRRPSFVQLCVFARHLMENTRDHAVTDLAGRPIDGVRFLVLRRINLTDVSLERLAAERAGSEADYLRALAVYMEHNWLNGGQLIEMTIADSGVGIPARMARTDAVYDGPFDAELSYLFAALKAGGTSKPTTATGSGYGLNRAIAAVAAIKGLLVVRTGRYRATFDSLKHCGFDGMTPSTPADYFDASMAPFAPGTSFSILIPWRLVQAQPDLFGGLLDAYRSR